MIQGLRLVLLVMVLCGGFQARAYSIFKSKDTLGIGYTDNANLTSTGQTSDTFFKLGTLDTLVTDPATFVGNLSYTEYSSQKQEDALNWNLIVSHDLTDRGEKGWDIYGAILGQSFPHGAPETTEAGFNYYGFEAGADRWQKLSPRLDWTLTPGYRFQKYTDFADRVDHSLFAMTDFKFAMNRAMTLKGDASLTFVGSTLPDYGRTIADIGGEYNYMFTPEWTFGAALLLRDTAFSSRAVSTTTLISTRRGLIKGTGQANENLSFVRAEASLTYSFSVHFAGKLSLASSSQNSLSGAENFTENQIVASLIGTF